MDDDSVLGEKDMWQLVQRLCPKHAADAVFSAIRHPSGHAACTPAEKADAFKCHYQRVGSHATFSSSNPQFDAAHMSHIAAEVQQHLYESANSTSASPCPLDAPITAAKVAACMQRLRSGKAGNPAEDGIVNELLKHGGSAVNDMLLQYCSLIWQLEQVHQVPGTIVSMPKKGDLANSTNYRSITLLSVLYKFYTSVLNQRLIQYAEGCLHLEVSPSQQQQQQRRQPLPTSPQQQTQPGVQPPVHTRQHTAAVAATAAGQQLPAQEQQQQQPQQQQQQQHIDALYEEYLRLREEDDMWEQWYVQEHMRRRLVQQQQQQQHQQQQQQQQQRQSARAPTFCVGLLLSVLLLLLQPVVTAAHAAVAAAAGVWRRAGVWRGAGVWSGRDVFAATRAATLAAPHPQQQSWQAAATRFRQQGSQQGQQLCLQL
jgi:hypothetical protein